MASACLNLAASLLRLARSRKRDAEEIERVQIVRLLLQLGGQGLDGGLKVLMLDVEERTLIAGPCTLSRLNRMAQEEARLQAQLQSGPAARRMIHFHCWNAPKQGGLAPGRCSFSA